jgi:hypothetical protein
MLTANITEPTDDGDIALKFKAGLVVEYRILQSLQHCYPASEGKIS